MPAVHHPLSNEKGLHEVIKKPHAPSSLSAWADSGAVATVVPGSPMPAVVNGLAIMPWAAPTTLTGWQAVHTGTEFAEPDMHGVLGKAPAAGAVIIEDDGRVWLISPTNGFGGYLNTFPKGRIEPGLDFRATACKEVFEESGLKVELTGFLCDVERTVTVTRLFLARRVGGDPAGMGWESQAVHLTPLAELGKLLSHPADALVLKALAKLPLSALA